MTRGRASFRGDLWRIHVTYGIELPVSRTVVTPLYSSESR
jgi:hypothetical protein